MFFHPFPSIVNDSQILLNDIQGAFKTRFDPQWYQAFALDDLSLIFDTYLRVVFFICIRNRWEKRRATNSCSRQYDVNIPWDGR